MTPLTREERAARAKIGIHAHFDSKQEAFNEESLLDANMPEWRDLVLTWDELHDIPKKWKSKLAEWRGIYTSRGKKCEVFG